MKLESDFAVLLWYSLLTKLREAQWNMTRESNKRWACIWMNSLSFNHCSSWWQKGIHLPAKHTRSGTVTITRGAKNLLDGKKITILFQIIDMLVPQFWSFKGCFILLPLSLRAAQQQRDVNERDKEWIYYLYNEFKKSLKQTNLWHVCINLLSECLSCLVSSRSSEAPRP